MRLGGMPHSARAWGTSLRGRKAAVLEMDRCPRAYYACILKSWNRRRKPFWLPRITMINAMIDGQVSKVPRPDDSKIKLYKRR